VQVEQSVSDGSDDEDRLKRYREEIAYYEKEAGAWHDKVRKILRRYKDERSPREQKIPRFNILYSNISTLMPAVYGRNPKPDIERRFKDNDPLGRVTSEVLERTCSYFVETEAFRTSMRNALFDRLMGGRGTVWARYVPHFKEIEPEELLEEEDEGVEVTDDVSEEAASEDSQEDEPNEEVTFEEAITDYVHWDDFGHNWARTYDEMYLAWRRVFLTRKDLRKRFGKEKADKIPLDYFPKGLNDQKKDVAQKKAIIYEVWDDQEKRVAWLTKDEQVSGFLDDKPDPLKLDGFFPFPKPLYGVLANDSLIPVPDYVEYQDQALELDELTSRIASITKSIKVAGVYDASAQGVERLLAEGTENKLIPVSQWAIFGEKGGLKGVMDLLPMKDIMETLLGLYEAREKVKGDLYEITGIADIIRGNSDPRETASAVKTKSNFATIRLSDTQDEMARFARDAVRNVCLIIATHFDIETIKRICGMKLLTTQEKQQIQMQQSQAKQQYQQAMQMFQNHQQMQSQVAQNNMPQGQQGSQGEPAGGVHPNMPPQQTPQPQMKPPPPPPPLPDNMIELMEDPTWEEVDALLKNEPNLSFKIDIEIDSTIKMDEEADKAARVEFLESSAKFIAAGITAGQQEPALMPLMAQMLMFGVRGFKVGKDLEGQFNVAMEKLEKAAANPPPKQNPEQMKIQGEMQIAQARMQGEQAMEKQKAQMQAQNDQRDAQREAQKEQLEEQRAQRQEAMEAKKNQAQTQNDLQLQREKMSMDMALQREKMQGEMAIKAFTAMHAANTATDAAAQKQNDGDKALKTHTDTVKQLILPLHEAVKHLSAPKTVKLDNGRTATVTHNVK
jgi:hypothetical protein